MTTETTETTETTDTWNKVVLLPPSTCSTCSTCSSWQLGVGCPTKSRNQNTMDLARLTGGGIFGLDHQKTVVDLIASLSIGIFIEQPSMQPWTKDMTEPELPSVQARMINGKLIILLVEEEKINKCQ